MSGHFTRGFFCSFSICAFFVLWHKWSVPVFNNMADDLAVQRMFFSVDWTSVTRPVKKSRELSDYLIITCFSTNLCNVSQIVTILLTFTRHIPVVPSLFLGSIVFPVAWLDSEHSLFRYSFFAKKLSSSQQAGFNISWRRLFSLQNDRIHIKLLQFLNQRPDTTEQTKSFQDNIRIRNSRR